MKQAQIDQGKRKGLISQEREEPRKLRKENRVLHQEQEGIVATVYYYTLTQLSPLRRLLPCTVNVVIEKL